MAILAQSCADSIKQFSVGPAQRIARLMKPVQNFVKPFCIDRFLPFMFIRDLHATAVTTSLPGNHKSISDSNVGMRLVMLFERLERIGNVMRTRRDDQVNADDDDPEPMERR